MEEKPITKTFSVSGMTCVNCENRIENKLKKLNGVISVTASYTRSQVIFIYDANRVKLSTIVETIEKMDYHVKRAGAMLVFSLGTVPLMFGLGALS
ncbi:heavy-metal-associated domain-containing protein [Acetobacterium sp.]|uniref:heavy-metal-associated domain-containing protein n=1 Tax=Acetobacterium sp. TaxID=1872094 RepID=UPI002F3EC019